MDPSLDQIEEMARETIARLPAPFLPAAKQVVLQVVDWPPEDILAEMGIDHPLELTGLYEGIPMTEKSVMDTPMVPDIVWLFREPILEEWRDRDGVSLADLVAHVTIHEFAHHFGLSDDDIAAIDPWWE